MDQFLERDIQYLKGVGDKRARLFHKLGIFVVGDLVRYYPRTYEDWSVTTPAAQAPEGTTVCVQATMVTPMRTHLIRKGMTLYKADFTDGETLIHVTLFNTKFQAEKLRMYQDYLLLGKVERNFTTVQMSAPKIEPLTARRIHPIYTQTGSLNANLIAKAVDYALAHMAPLPDTLSPALREKYGLEDLDTAVRNIHFPSNAKALEAARHRLIFEELLTLTSREQAVLEALIARPGRVMSKEQLASQVFGLDEEASPDAIEIYIHRLRKKLDGQPVAIVTFRGLGYLLESRDA